MSEGYTLDQLLAWCLEDRLIDSYSQSENVITIIQGDLRHELSVDQARDFLRGIFTNSPVVRARKQWEEPGAARAPDENVA